MKSNNNRESYKPQEILSLGKRKQCNMTDIFKYDIPEHSNNQLQASKHESFHFALYSTNEHLKIPLNFSPYRLLLCKNHRCTTKESRQIQLATKAGRTSYMEKNEPIV